MSQNPFGQSTFGAPQQSAPAEPTPADEPQEKNAAVRKWALIGGVAVLTGAVALGAITLTAGGDDEDLTAAPATARPAVASTPATTEAPVPLPTLAEFNGRNPFKAKIVEGTGGSGGGATTAPTGTSSTSGTSGTGGTGSTGGSWTGGGSITLPGKDGKDGKDGRDGKDGSRGQDGAAGEGAPFLYVMLVDVTEDADGDLVGMFALGAGLDVELFEGRLADGKLTSPSGDPLPAPAKWIRVQDMDAGTPAKEAPSEEVIGDGSTGDGATIQFGDVSGLALQKMVPFRLL